MSSSRGPRPVVVLLGALGVLALGGLLWLQRLPSAGEGGGRSEGAGPPAGDERGAAPAREDPRSALSPDSVRVPAGRGDGGAAALRTGARARLTWGAGPSSVGKPTSEEGHGEAPLSLAADGSGNLLVLDAVNRRVVRLGPDGQPLAPLPLPSGEVKDLAVSAAGTWAVLDTHDQQRVTLTAADGRVVGALPVVGGSVQDAESVRGVVISGDDVYVESYQGDLTRIGDVRGQPDTARPTPPGQPTRDGRGYLTARITEAEAGLLHVAVVERDTQQQRFSRQLRLPYPVEGLFLVDTDKAGVIYLGLTLTPTAPGAPRLARLLCLEPQRGELSGQADLPVNFEDEAIVDAVALDPGGVAYTVWTPGGLRVEQQGCP